ncbi:MAG: hypothetical protein ED555_03045 [Allomuricauda sp.]|nr:MAG: hypothetical protein ED555_03045 [Allomuricauda sp.]
MTENNTAGYLKYALGEIALVVIGILIALQINNWNENRKDKKALNEYLIKIKSHTQEDLLQLEQMIIGRRRTLEDCKKARKSILDKTENANLPLFMATGFAFFDYYFKPNTGGYEALKNSRYFGKINNTPLDSLLANYHAQIGQIAHNEKNYNDFAENQEAYLSTQFDRSLMLAYAFMPPDSLKLRATQQSEYFKSFEKYTASVPYRNVVSVAAFQFEAMIYQYQQLSASGQIVIEEINAIVEDE